MRRNVGPAGEAERRKQDIERGSSGAPESAKESRSTSLWRCVILQRKILLIARRSCRHCCNLAQGRIGSETFMDGLRWLARRRFSTRN
jgi:hypothetical protein